MNIDKIKDIFDKYSKEENFSGVALIKRGDEDLFSYTYGYAHRGYKIENSMATRFDTASITKLFTSVSIFQLLDQNLISLQDKVLDILDLENTSISKEVTIYHLLTHTSGIGDDADEEAGESYADLWREKPNYSVRKIEDFLLQFIYREPNFEPGKGCRYNNCAYILLGLVIQKITGKDYYDYVKENIFDKISMKNTYFYSMDEINEEAAEGYVPLKGENDEIVGWKKNIYSYPPKGAPDAGAYTTVHDLDIFLRAFKENKLLSKELTEEIMKHKEFYFKNDARSYYMGYGFEYGLRNSDNKVFCIYKDGSNEGVACTTRYYPEIDTTFTILGNTNACNIWNLAFEVQAYLGIEVE